MQVELFGTRITRRTKFEKYLEDSDGVLYQVTGSDCRAYYDDKIISHAQMAQSGTDNGWVFVIKPGVKPELHVGNVRVVARLDGQHPDELPARVDRGEADG